jgi:chromate transporter
MPTPSLRAMASVFLRIGNLTFGGGDPTIAAMQRELIDRKQWLREDHFAISNGLARVTPGTNVLAFSAAVGWFLHGLAGAFVAVVSASLPSALFSVWLLAAYQQFSSSPLVQAAFSTILAAVVGIMGASVILLVRPRFKPGRRVRAILITGGACFLHFRYGISPVAILAVAALTGLVGRDR